MSKYNVERQWALQALTTIDLAVDPADTSVVVVLPPNSIIIDGTAIVTTAFNGTTPKLTAVDNSGSPISFFGTVDATVPGVTQIVGGQGHPYPSGGTVTISVSGSPTAGKTYVRLGYVVVDRANEIYTVGSFNN